MHWVSGAASKPDPVPRACQVNCQPPRNFTEQPSRNFILFYFSFFFFFFFFSFPLPSSASYQQHLLWTPATALAVPRPMERGATAALLLLLAALLASASPAAEVEERGGEAELSPQVLTRRSFRFVRRGASACGVLVPRVIVAGWGRVAWEVGAGRCGGKLLVRAIGCRGCAV